MPWVGLVRVRARKRLASRAWAWLGLTCVLRWVDAVRRKADWQPPCNRRSCNWFDIVRVINNGTHGRLTCYGLHSEPHSRKRTSQMQTASTASQHLYRPISPRHSIMHSVPLYCIQPLYSHYTTTIQPEEVMSEAWGSAWEPQRSGAVRATSGSTPNVLYNGVPGSTSGSTPNVLYNGSRMVRW